MNAPAPAVGQLLMLGCDGLQPSDDLLHWIRHRDLGGFFVFGPNLGDRDQFTTFIADLQAAAPRLPLFVAMDLEGGRVQLWRRPHWRNMLWCTPTCWPHVVGAVHAPPGALLADPEAGAAAIDDGVMEEPTPLSGEVIDESALEAL